MRHIYLPLCVATLMLCGCNKDDASTDAKEERNPLVKTGLSYMEIKDYKKAAASFKEAIDSNPRMARPYLDLATIYHQYDPDYISAIFYYKKYLELRPDTEKAKLIQDQIEKVQMALANAILTQSGAVQAMQELKQLRTENAELKRQLAAIPKPAATPQPAVATAQPTTAQKGATATPSAKPASATAQNHQIYTVAAGDTLSKIAAKYYGDSGQWDAIYQANKDRMKSPGDLRVGQTLVIPKAGN